MKPSQAITEFQQSCQRYFICYSFSKVGLQEEAKKWQTRGKNHRNLIVGTGHPDEKRWHAVIKIGDAISNAQENGIFPDMIAKSFLVAMYSEWDEVFRHRVALENGVDAKSIKCDLMGDLRWIRHCIVHNKSIVVDEHEKIKELKWQLEPGPLTISRAMFAGLIDQINQMLVRVEPPKEDA